jgi:hypothetical protein
VGDAHLKPAAAEDILSLPFRLSKPAFLSYIT